MALGFLQWEVPPNSTWISITHWILGWSRGLLFSPCASLKYELPWFKWWKPNFSHHRFIYFCFIILVIFMNSSLYVTQISLDQEVGSIAVSQMPNQIWYWNKEDFCVGPFVIHISWQQFCLGFSFSSCYKTFSTLFCGTKSREDFTPTSLWCPSTCIIWGIEPT